MLVHFSNTGNPSGQVIGTTFEVLLMDAWLSAAALSPVWIWGLIGLEEAGYSCADNNHRFVTLIAQVRPFQHCKSIRHMRRLRLTLCARNLGSISQTTI